MKPRAKQLGVDDDRYAEMLRAQGGGCAICGNPPKTRRLDVDHDHRSGKIRGLLDHRCNRLLPSWVTLAWLDSAYRYIVRHELAESGRLLYDVEERGHETPCWVWKRARHSDGYGVIRVRGELLYVHRLMYHGLIPRGYEIDHLCTVKPCINPLHLEAVTSAENTRRHFRAPECCKRGHVWTEANTYYRPDGSGRRQCRECIRIRSAGAHRR